MVPEGGVARDPLAREELGLPQFGEESRTPDIGVFKNVRLSLKFILSRFDQKSYL
jgi:hypothetical protein